MSLDNSQNTNPDYDKILNDTIGEKEMAEGFEKIRQYIANPDAGIEHLEGTKEPQTEDEVVETKVDDEENDEVESEDADSDEVESDEDDEGEDEEENKVKKAPKRKDNKAYWLTKDLYKVKAEKIAAEQKVRELQQLLEESVSASTYHYGKNAYNELETAEIRQTIAMESGDPVEFLKAQKAVIKALNAVNELEKYTAPERATQPSYENNNPYANQELAQEWLSDHPELKPNSKRYNPTLHKKLDKYVSNLDRHLQSTNQAHLIFSPDYFDAIDNHLEEIQQASKKKEIKAPKSEAYMSNVGGVRNSHTPGKAANQVKQFEITEAEKTMAKWLNVSEASLIKSKMEYAKLNKHPR